MYIAVCDDHIEELEALTKQLEFWQKDRGFPLRFKTFHSAAEMLSTAERELFSLSFGCADARHQRH